MSTLERLTPEDTQGSEASGKLASELHLQRYRFASKILADFRGDVLDAACGIGYGSFLIATASAVNVTGIDRDKDSIQYAKAKYAAGNLNFVLGDVCELMASKKFEAIVSFETLEHVSDPKRMLSKFRELISADGVLVCSVPVTFSSDVNPFHLYDFSFKTFHDALRDSGFVVRDYFLQEQKYGIFSVWGEKRMADMRQNLIGYYLSNPKQLLRRVMCTMKHGFVNKYCVCVATVAKPEENDQERMVSSS